NGQRQPADGAESLAFANLCQLPCKKLYAAAARLYAAAFAADPKVASDHRYNAACAAALAGCCQGQDAKNLNEKECGRLRRQALVWLGDELAGWRKLLEQQPEKTRAALARQMQHWLADADFAGVRAEAALGKLPEAERKDWRQLWADVEKTLVKAREKPKKP